MISRLQEIMRSKPNLVSLCGITNDATEADLSGLDMTDADDAIILVSELPDKGALKKLNLSDTEIPWKTEKDILKLCSSKGIKLKIGIDGCRGT
jgi:hypothetical protein